MVKIKGLRKEMVRAERWLVERFGTGGGNRRMGTVGRFI